MLHIYLDRESRRTFTRQIYVQLREIILRGELRGGERLPSTRELADELCVSRNTVMTAIDMLASEGFLYSKPGSGVFVGDTVRGFSHVRITISDYTVPALSADILPPELISFDSGIPAIDLFPRKDWNRCVSRAFAEAPASALGYDDPQGRPELRKILTSYLARTRGLFCDPEQIIITSGAKQGLTLIAKCLLGKNSEVWIEDPSNANVRQIFSYHTNRIIPIPVDSRVYAPRLFRVGKNRRLFLSRRPISSRWAGFCPCREGLNW